MRSRSSLLAALLTLALAACAGPPSATIPVPERESLRVGDAAPTFSLPTADGDAYPSGETDSRTLLFFSMGPGCEGCVRQIADLERDQGFQELDVELVSVAIDPPESWRAAASEASISSTLLSDADGSVSASFGVMRWAMGNEPGHTFVLLDADGQVRWIRDYGAPENGGRMYVPPQELLDDLARGRVGGDDG